MESTSSSTTRDDQIAQELELVRIERDIMRDDVKALIEEVNDLRRKNAVIKQEQEDRMECIICQDNTKEYAAQPCGHILFCSHCCNGRMARNCPLCNNPVRSLVRVFL